MRAGSPSASAAAGCGCGCGCGCGKAREQWKKATKKRWDGVADMYYKNACARARPTGLRVWTCK